MNHKRLNLVLGGGGIHLITHMGFIDALTSRGYIIEGVAGTSAGALVASLLANARVKHNKPFLKDYIVDIFPLPLKTRWWPFGFPQSRYKSKPIQRHIKKLLFDDMCDSSIPYAVVVADIVERRQLVLKSWESHEYSAAEAAYASMCVPGLFEPLDGRLVDGGILSNCPKDDIEFPNNHRTVGVYFEHPEGKKPESFGEYLGATIDTIIAHNTREDMSGEMVAIQVETPSLDLENVDMKLVRKLYNNGFKHGSVFVTTDRLQTSKGQFFGRFAETKVP